MTSVSRITSSPEQDDEASTTEGLATHFRAVWLIRNAVPKLRGGWLATASIRWDMENASSSPRGAVTPEAARNTLTRQAQRKKRIRQMKQRAGMWGLCNAILNPR